MAEKKYLDLVGLEYFYNKIKDSSSCTLATIDDILALFDKTKPEVPTGCKFNLISSQEGL